MNTKDVLDKLRQDMAGSGYASNTRKSQQWLLQKVQTMSQRTASRLNFDDRSRDRIMLGKMYFFKYDAKGKDVLPMFDRFPLVFPIERYTDGFLGLNFHYLPIPQRALLLARLLDYTSNETMNETTKIRMTYDTLSSVSKLKIARPCIKRYLYSHVRSKFIYVDASEWQQAIYLPAENWYVNRRK
jgi:hypothetical protein